ncbi:Derepression protein [Salmonella enterica]|nr:Derepression protein [Salmonella enterica]EAS0588210.1 Derepression protein [Salmonella enterica subsp. enterica serovar Clackamas]ECV1773583.1 Derepression protein [Salmonella enterica subsp. enterica serovar Bareilly]EDQ4636895.1 Derepression protein [Salmonella enterica subsp. enterica serovar Arechavaleta]EHP7148158.1 Derepression protein [Salmonella enterica subsp. enterica serovar Thompson]
MNKPQISIECYHKLNRSSAVAQYFHLDMYKQELNGTHQLYIPHILSYIHEDIAAVLKELKEKGFCDDWLQQEHKKSAKE